MDQKPSYHMDSQGFDQPPAYSANQPSSAPPGTAIQVVQPIASVSGCPPGLEYLLQVDQILCQQAIEILEALVGLECRNRFQVKNSMGQLIYLAGEESDFCMRICCGPARGFTMHVTDNFGKEVLRTTREFKCCAGCCWCASNDCCAWEMMVEAPVGNPIGYVRQSCSVWRPHYEIMDEHREPVLHIAGPCCIIECPCIELDFRVLTTDGEEIGKINKFWSGALKECCADADNFGISFPIDLDVKMKGTLLGAVFMINMMFFEQKNK